MLKDHKQLCSRIAPAGWRYGGFDAGFYVFVSGDYSKGFKEMKCLEDDLTAENLYIMVKYNATR